MKAIETRVKRLEAAQRPNEGQNSDDGSEALWRRLEAIEAHLLASGDDLQHKPTSSPAANAVRAIVRGEPENAADIIRDVIKDGHQRV